METKEILDSIPEHEIISYLREEKNKAFILWGTADVIDAAENMGFDITEDEAIGVITSIGHHQDCTIGITWETIDAGIEDLIEDNSYDVLILNDEDVEIEAQFCSLGTNGNIDEYWNDDEYMYYGITKEDLSKFEGKQFEDIGRIIKVL